MSCVLENLMLYNIPGSQAVCFQGTKKKKNWGENYIKEKVLFFKKLLWYFNKFLGRMKKKKTLASSFNKLVESKSF